MLDQVKFAENFRNKVEACMSITREMCGSLWYEMHFNSLTTEIGMLKQHILRLLLFLRIYHEVVYGVLEEIYSGKHCDTEVYTS